MKKTKSKQLEKKESIRCKKEPRGNPFQEEKRGKVVVGVVGEDGGRPGRGGGPCDASLE